MEEHPLSSEKAFEKYLETLSCNGCIFFIDKKCTQEKAEENEADKKAIVEFQIATGKQWNIEWAKNIDNHFMCDNFESKSKK